MERSIRVLVGVVIMLSVALAQSMYAQEPPPVGSPAPGPKPPGKHEGMGPGMGGPKGHKGPMGPDWEDKDLKELIDTVRIFRLSRALELTDEQTVMLMRRYDDLKKQISDLWEKRNQMMEQLRDKVNKNAPEAEIEQVLNDLSKLEEESFYARRDLLKKAGQDLTITQRAKLLLFMQDFERDMRKLLERAREFQGGDKEAIRGELRKRIQEWNGGRRNELPGNPIPHDGSPPPPAKDTVPPPPPGPGGAPSNPPPQAW
ncbi:MAG TPA: hypothetical protein PKY35_10060 [Candidatus Hydrogenedentes bacterium]|nr:hypothetical protein [Candidatus Hydrogenedentota bacterium]HOL77364.1 hypothetical protein [Candidatus Hydrogenedentota bacterium]HPO84818.1 hypothetical protein [Candidatus Hydrogenedentota bacterium]